MYIVCASKAFVLLTFFLGGAVSFPLKVSLPPSGATNYDRPGPFKAKRNTQQRGQQSFSWEEKKKETALEKKEKNLQRIRLDFCFPLSGKRIIAQIKQRENNHARMLLYKKGDFSFSPLILPIVLRFERAAPVIISTHPF